MKMTMKSGATLLSTLCATLIGICVCLCAGIRTCPAEDATFVASGSTADDSGIRSIENGGAVAALIAKGKTFSRIISLYGAHTENLVLMGAKETLVGVSRGDEESLGLPVFDVKSGAENFLAARPDLVLMRPMHARAYQGLVTQLENAGVVVLALQPRTATEMFSYWQALGALCGHRPQADGMVDGFKKKLAALQAGRIPDDLQKRKRVYFESMHDKVKTFSPDSIALYVLDAAGGVNVATDAVAVRGSNIAAYGKERIFSHADTIDFYLAQCGAMNDVTEEKIRADYGLLPAVREGRVVVLDEGIVSRPTPHLLEGVSLLLDRFYGQRVDHESRVKGELE